LPRLLARGRGLAVKGESQRVLKAGNEYALQPVIVLTLAEVVGLTLSAEAARALGTTLPPLRADVLDFSGWSQLAATEDPVPIAAVVEVLAVAVQRYVFWPVSFCGWRPAPAGSERQGAAAGRAVFEIGTRKAGVAASKAVVALAAALLEEQGPQELTRLSTER
jgi:cyanophycin synthetase